ncbi:MAG: HNH endonuclease [Planctomycetota bacterium]
MPTKPQTYLQRLRARQRPAVNAKRTTRVYDRRWQRVRAVKVAQDPLCEECGRHGRTTATTEVDHIIPIRQGGAVYDLANLQSMCKPCHSRTTARENAFGKYIVGARYC